MPANTSTMPATGATQSGAGFMRLRKPRNASSGTSPLAVQTVRYPATKAAVGSQPSPRAPTTMRWAKTIGATAGSIMAVIIASHIAMKTGTATLLGMRWPTSARPLTIEPIPSACRAVIAQATAAKATKAATTAVVARDSTLLLADARGSNWCTSASGEGDRLGAGDDLFYNLCSPDNAYAFRELVFGDAPRLGTRAAEPNLALVGDQLSDEIAELRQASRLDTLAAAFASKSNGLDRAQDYGLLSRRGRDVGGNEWKRCP